MSYVIDSEFDEALHEVQDSIRDKFPDDKDLFDRADLLNTLEKLPTLHEKTLQKLRNCEATVPTIDELIEESALDRVTFQLYPDDEESRRKVRAAGFNPLLELTVSVSRANDWARYFRKIHAHVARKWAPLRATISRENVPMTKPKAGDTFRLHYRVRHGDKRKADGDDESGDSDVLNL